MQSCDKLNRVYQFTYMLLFWTTEPPIVTFEYHINTGTFIPVVMTPHLIVKRILDCIVSLNRFPPFQPESYDHLVTLN